MNYICCMGNKNENTFRSAGKLINELARASHIFFHAEFRKYSIGHGQIRTLFFIAHHEGLTQMELAKHLKLDKSSITSQLQLLERNGYIVRRTSDTDARKQVIGITPSTKKILGPMRKVLEDWSETLLEGFDHEEQELLLSYLERMRNNARNRIENITHCK